MLQGEYYPCPSLGRERRISGDHCIEAHRFRARSRQDCLFRHCIQAVLPTESQ